MKEREGGKTERERERIRRRREIGNESERGEEE